MWRCGRAGGYGLPGERARPPQAFWSAGLRRGLVGLRAQRGAIAALTCIYIACRKVRYNEGSEGCCTAACVLH